MQIRNAQIFRNIVQEKLEHICHGLLHTGKYFTKTPLILTFISSEFYNLLIIKINLETKCQL